MKRQIALIAVCAVLAVCVLAAGCSGPTASPSSASPSAAASPAQALTPSATGASPSATPTPSVAPTPSATPSGSSASGLTLMFFYRPTCPKCQATEPIIKQLEANYNGKVAVVRLNDDDPANGADVTQYRASIVPTLILLKNGVEVQRWVDPINYAAVAGQIDSQLSAG